MGIIQKIKNLIKRPAKPALTSMVVGTEKTLTEEEIKKQKIARLEEEYERQNQRGAFYFAIDAAVKLLELGIKSHAQELQSLGKRALDEGYINSALQAYGAISYNPDDEEIRRGIEKALDIGATLISLDALLEIQDPSSKVYKNWAAQKEYKTFVDKITREIWQKNQDFEKEKIRKIRGIYSFEPLPEN